MSNRSTGHRVAPKPTTEQVPAEETALREVDREPLTEARPRREPPPVVTAAMRPGLVWRSTTGDGFVLTDQREWAPLD